jgi:hypothetical protein
MDLNAEKVLLQKEKFEPAVAATTGSNQPRNTTTSSAKLL